MQRTRKSTRNKPTKASLDVLACHLDKAVADEKRRALQRIEDKLRIAIEAEGLYGRGHLLDGAVKTLRETFGPELESHTRHRLVARALELAEVKP